MHLKILLGVLTLGLVTASPKAAAKPAAKASPQDYSNGQPFYDPSNSFGHNYAAQTYPGQPSLGYYNVRYAPPNYGYSAGYSTGNQYPQVSGNYYQQPQLVPVPVAYSSVPGNSVYNGYYGGARLWPKNVVSPTGSPSPVTTSSPTLYYPSSTPSPAAYQSTGNYVNSPFIKNYQAPVSTPSPVQPQYQQPIPVPVKVGLRNSFQPEVTNYNTASQSRPVSSAPYFPKYQQQSSPAPFLQQSYQQSTPAPFLQQSYQQSTPAPFLQQSYQQPTAIPYAAYQQAKSVPYVAQYQHPTSAPYQVNYQQQPYSYHQGSASPFVTYQQQHNAGPHSANYQQPGIGYNSPNYQRIPVPVAYPHIQPQPTKPTLGYSIAPTSSYPSIPLHSQQISILPTSPAPTTKTVTITEKPYVTVSTTPTPITKPKATIIKSEYNAGTVSPQYNHIPSYSTASPFAYSANQYLPHSSGKPTYYPPSYNPFKSTTGYLPSTAVSHVSYNGLGASYSYKK